MRGLFINQIKANCSIYESGVMCYKALKYGEKYSLDYLETNTSNNIDITSYDFYVFNWHFVTTSFLTEQFIKTIKKPKFTIVTEMLPNNPFIRMPKMFDKYLVLDPTQTKTDLVIPMPRPLEEFNEDVYTEADGVVIGSFGFATPGKQFDLLVRLTSNEFDKAKIKINLPVGHYVDSSAHISLAAQLREIPVKSGISLHITHDFMDKTELIKWCASNTINVFLYNRNLPGLAAVTDQAISAKKPLLVSDNSTFRHIHSYLGSYPNQTILDAINNSKEGVLKMYEDWHPRNFGVRFEEALNG